MKTALYSRIVLAADLNDKTLTESSIITRAQRAGYSMVQFNGWDNNDLGTRSNPGPRKEDASANSVLLREIEELFPDGCGYSDIQIQQTAPEQVRKTCVRCGFQGIDLLDDGETCPACNLE